MAFSPLLFHEPRSVYGPTHFDGDWTDAERRLIQSAIADAEILAAGRGPKARLALRETPWIFYCKHLPGFAVYMAHRPGWSLVLHAGSAAALGLEILQFIEEQVQDIER